MDKRNKKIFSSATAVVAALAILVSGTLAFLGGASAINRFRDLTDEDRVTETGANLHDDFVGMGGVDASSVVDKDVYVENTGDKEVFVRIKLSEELDGGGKTLFVPTVDGVGTITNATGNTPGFDWKLGSTTPKSYNSITETTEWNAYPINTTAGEKTDLVADAKGSATAANKADTSTGTSAGNTLDQDGVISMKAFLAKNATDRAAFVGWIYDENDGYAYWSQPLAPGTATGRLLDSVKVPVQGSQTYTYDITVEMEYVDLDDMGAWTNGDAIKSGPKAGDTTDTVSNDAKTAVTGIVSLRAFMALSPAKTGDTENWIEIARNGEHSLIVRVAPVGTGVYKETIPHIAYDSLDINTAGNLRHALNDWYDNGLNSGANLRDYVVGHDALTKQGIYASLDAANGFSAPTGALATGTKADIAFPLSFQEVASYVSAEWYDTTQYIASPQVAIDNMERMQAENKMGDWIWLRSPSSSVNGTSTWHGNGRVAFQSVVRDDGGIIPALWVKTAIFD